MQVRPLGLPPWERENWRWLNNGQRMYAVRQHNIARVARGLPQIEPPPDEPYLDEALENYHHNFRDWDEHLFDEFADQPQTTLGEPSTSGGKGQGQKRKPGLGNKGKPKHQRVNEDGSPQMSQTNSQTQPNTQQAATKATAPTTGKAADNAMEIGDDDQAAGDHHGGSSNSMFMIPPNIKVKKRFSLVFGKTIRAWSFGMSSEILSRPVTGYTQYFLSTSLAEIPLHRLEMYMSPGEYALLPPGALCEKITCHVYQRNPIIQFETGGSTTKEATLNQVKQCIFAEGLNLTGKGVNVNYLTFANGENMKPATFGAAIYDAAGSYKGLGRTFYGSSVSSGTFSGDVPYVALGQPVCLQNYWSWIQSSRTSTGANAGWPETTRYFKQWDGADSINAPIASYEYHPACAPITPPLDFIQPYIPSNTVPAFSGGSPYRVRDTTLTTITTGQISTKTHAAGKVTLPNPPVAGDIDVTFVNTENQDILPLAGSFTYTSSIEKSANFKFGSRQNHPVKVQPSFHVGIMPCPTGNTDALANPNNNYDDARVEFVICTEMTVSFPMNNDYTNQKTNVIPVHSRIYQHSAIGYSTNSVTHNGLEANVTPFTDT